MQFHEYSSYIHLLPILLYSIHESILYPYKKDDVARTVLMQIYGEIMILNVRNN